MDQIEETLDYIERKMKEEKEEAIRIAVEKAHANAEQQGRQAAEFEARTSAFNEAKRLRFAELEKHRCPRCRGFIPTNDNPGGYVGARSRVTDIMICSPCGTDESMLQMTTGSTPQPDQWPVTRKYDINEAVLIAALKRYEESENL